MLVFGHAGITLGAAALLSGVLNKDYSFGLGRGKASSGACPLGDCSPAQNCSSSNKGAWPISFHGHHVDIRLLLVGSLLPDIIDKPLGQYLLRDTLSNGRVYCHTLLFFVLVAIAGLYLYRSHKRMWLLVLSFGIFAHLLLDQMWLELRVLLWPSYGLAFGRIDLAHWLWDIFRSLYTAPAVYVPELIGVAILVWFVVMLVRQRRVFAVIRNGIV